MADRLSTGVAVIDRHMEGGVPKGSLLAISAPPESQSDLLLTAAASAADTHVVTTTRSAEAVLQQFKSRRIKTTNLTFQAVDPAAFAADPDTVLDAVPSDGYLIIDGFEEFERLDDSTHKTALRALGASIRDRESVGVLHCARQETRTGARRRTLGFADVVWQLHLVISSLHVDTRLTVTKVRGGKAYLDPIKLKLTDRVSVDTSRDIA